MKFERVHILFLVCVTNAGLQRGLMMFYYGTRQQIVSCNHNMQVFVRIRKSIFKNALQPLISVLFTADCGSSLLSHLVWRLFFQGCLFGDNNVPILDRDDG